MSLPASGGLFLDGDAVFNFLHALHTFGQDFRPVFLRVRIDKAAQLNGALEGFNADAVIFATR